MDINSGKKDKDDKDDESEFVDKEKEIKKFMDYLGKHFIKNENIEKDEE